MKTLTLVSQTFQTTLRGIGSSMCVVLCWVENNSFTSPIVFTLQLNINIVQISGKSIWLKIIIWIFWVTVNVYINFVQLRKHLRMIEFMCVQHHDWNAKCSLLSLSYLNFCGAFCDLNFDWFPSFYSRLTTIGSHTAHQDLLCPISASIQRPAIFLPWETWMMTTLALRCTL